MKKILVYLILLLFIKSADAQCTANFNITMSPVGTVLLRAQFVNTSTYSTLPAGKYVSYYLYWGDGNQNPVGTYPDYNSYASTGTYIVSLVMTIRDSSTNAIYCKDSTAKNFTVFYTPCATTFTTTLNPTNPLQVTVTANNPAGTSGMTYTWNWNDATPNSSGITASHTYSSSGSKGITMTATDGSCTYSYTYIQPVYYPGCIGRLANFTFSTNGTKTVYFANSSTSSPGYTQNCYWNFGDATTSTGNSLSHTYSSYGSYTVSLITQWVDNATSTVSCSDTTAKTVDVPAYNLIGGYIVLDSLQAIPYPQYKVWLIQYDSSTTSLIAVDSQNVTGPSDGQYTWYEFDDELMGTYRIKAKLLNGPTSGSGFIPTYHTSSLMWNSATLVSYSSGSLGGKDIRMQYGTVTSGPGFIGGNVSAGANKGTKDGIPDIDVILFDNNRNPIAYTVTDANGDFSFNNIPTGNYIIHPEDMNYTTTPATATVAANNTTVTNVDFLRSENHKTITPNTTGITAIKSEVLNIYPNPAKDRVIITMNSATETKSELTIMNINSLKIYQQSFNGNHAEVDLKGCSRGIYFIKLENENINLIRKLAIE